MYKYLNFFNKKGEYANFQYDETNDKWIGRIDFNTVSEGIVEDFQLYIMEEVYNPSNLVYEMAYPLIDVSYLPGPTSPIGPSGATADSVKIKASFDPIYPVEDLFIYDFDLGPTANTLNKYYELDFDFIYDVNQTVAGNNALKPGIKQTTTSFSNALQINLGFEPSSEQAYESVLYLRDISGHLFAEILLYGEGEEEDERLRDLLQSMGHDLLSSDSIIFDTSDVNEQLPDWTLINRKRKELLMEFENIFPYVGSYKALINIIKYFGYQNLRMKEYWLNIDQTSVYFGKYKQIDITDIFDDSANYITSGLVPSKIYKKTSKFGLYYDITVPSGDFDEDGVPIAEEVFSFSPQEILIKIYALKKKLQNYYLPVNAKIVDIIGEAVYFGKYEMNVWNDQYRIDAVSLGLKPKFTILPKREGYIEDLRPLNFFGCPVGPDLTLGGTSNMLSWRIGFGNTAQVGGILDGIQTFYLDFQVPGPTSYYVTSIIKRDPDTGQTAYAPNEIANSIVRSVNNYGSPISNNFLAYQEGGSSGIVRIIQTSPIGNGIIYVGATSNTAPSGMGGGGGMFLPGPTASLAPILGSTGGTSVSINVSNGPSGSFGASGAPMSYYGDCFLGYFDRINLGVTQLNDDEDIPVGYPVVLQNDTFDITWDDANVTFNQIDQLQVSTNNLLYSNFTLSQTISSWGSTSTPVYTPVPGFPIYFPSQNVYTWNNLGFYGYYEMQWIVTREGTGPSFVFDSGRKSIDDLNSCPVILPYVGKYKVELYLWDGYNTKSFLINESWIEVNIPESDFIAWYQFRELEYQIDTKRYKVQSDFAQKPPEFGPPQSDYLTWDEYASTWDLPLHPNEEIGMSDISYNSLDAIEFYQNQVNPSPNPLIDRFPYTYDLITRLPSWDNLYHLWWDGIGTKVTQWEITGVTGPTSYLFMTRGNTIVNLQTCAAHYVDGPTGYTGATGATSLIGATGDIIVSNSNRRTYMWDGSEWKYIIDIVDTYKATGLIGSTKDKFIELSRQLNQVMPYDGFDHPFLTDFIYYYNEEYDFAYSLNPYIRAVSKDFDSPKRHAIKYQGATGNTFSYDTVYFGYVGDIPTHFEICWVSPTGPYGSIYIDGMTSPYSIGSTNLTDLCNELNSPSAQAYNILGDYEFNLVLGYSGMTGPSGPYVTPTEVKIQGISKRFTWPKEINLQLNGIVGTEYGRSLIKNPTWDQIRILKYSQELPLCTVVNFTYDPSKLKGKKNPIWKLSKLDDSDFGDIYYKNRYFSYMFTERGSYTVSLVLEDTNGNKQTVTKNEIIKII
jgi:hypothetical protein